VTIIRSWFYMVFSYRTPP